MPRPSKRISGIVPSGKDGWEVHTEAWARKEAGQDIIMEDEDFHREVSPRSARGTPLCPAGHLPLKGGDWQSLRRACSSR